MADVKKGIILKGIGGLYFVETADAVFECKARGIFRKSGQKPLVGDEVDILIGEDGASNTIDDATKKTKTIERKLKSVADIEPPKDNDLITFD